jgi:DNA polymerase (family 10)
MNKNKILAQMFEKIGDALDFQGENTFKIAAYRKAARVLEDLPEDVEEIYKKKGVEGLIGIPGIGERIAKKIAEFLETGRMRKYDEVMGQVPQELISLLDVQGLGPRTLRLAYEKLGVKNLDDLKRVLDDGSLAALPGMGEKKVENIKKGLELYEKMRERIPLGLAYPIVQEIIMRMKELKEVEDISACGSFRRMKETVGDLDILVKGKDGSKIIQYFTELPGVTRVLASGETKGSVIFNDRFQVDMRVVPASSYGAALQYFTGSKAHNIHLRTIAKGLGLKISEYGVFKGDDKIGGVEEEDVYKSLGLPWIPPELREDWGEIEAAEKGVLPDLVTMKDIRGDLHVHSKYSDGTATLEEIAKYAKEMGYEYIVIADHSKSVKYARGLEPERLLKKIEEIKNLNEKLEGIRLLAGAEVDILQDGSLDYDDELLSKLDFVIAAIHIWSKKEDTTKRILKAMENPNVHAIAHPTGRLISSREGYQVDMEAIIEKAAQTGTALEINAFYDRLDLQDIYVKRAKERGVKIIIGTDAHNMGQLWMMELGVGIAKRGWLERKDLLNTLSLEEFLDFVKGMKG